MKTTTKQLLLSIGLLIIWIGFVLNGGSIAQFVVSALGGWMAGGIIYNIAVRIYPND